MMNFLETMRAVLRREGDSVPVPPPDIVIEPAAADAKPIYVEQPDGCLYGPGVQIAWTRADGSYPTGVIDYLHTDPTGVVWAFITLPGGLWTAVNLTCARVA